MFPDMPLVINTKDGWAISTNSRGISVLAIAKTESEPAVSSINVTRHGVR